jgi:hypothetical protein
MYDFKDWVNGCGKRALVVPTIGTVRVSMKEMLLPLARARTVRPISRRHQGIPRGSSR